MRNSNSNGIGALGVALVVVALGCLIVWGAHQDGVDTGRKQLCEAICGEHYDVTVTPAPAACVCLVPVSP